MAKLTSLLLEPTGKSVSGESNYLGWLKENFPNAVSKPMGERHIEAWEWMASLQEGEHRPPKLFVWPRGGGKSTTVELGCAYVGDRLARKFVLYVCGTQDQADRHVQAVSNMLQKLGHSPLLNKQGNSQGWRREQLRTAHGFNVAGIGLDVAIRGVKLDEFRPDWIIFDDIDGREDTPKKTEKKIRALTQDILPAGSSEVCVSGFQNLIIEDGVISRIVDGRSDYLLDATVSGPYPAVRNLVIEDAILENGRKYKKIVGGEATWEGQSLEVCQRQILKDGWISFKREAQQEVKGGDGFFFDVAQLNYIDAAELPRLTQIIRAWDLAGTQGGGDYTAGVLIGVAPNGNVYVLDVKRHQFSSDRVRKLLAATAERDKNREVWSADEVDETGLVIAKGARLYGFQGSVSTLVPDDPGQAGTDQAQQLQTKLRESTDAATVAPTGKKAVRARGFAEAVGNGNVFLVRGDWNHHFTEELRKFREDEQHDFDDQVDGASDAYNGLSKPQLDLNDW